jgi:hypothetical protein
MSDRLVWLPPPRRHAASYPSRARRGPADVIAMPPRRRGDARASGRIAVFPAMRVAIGPALALWATLAALWWWL